MGGAGDLGAAGVTKTLAVVCSAGAVTAGVCLPALKPDASHRDPRPRAEREARPAKRSTAPSPRAVRAAVATPSPASAKTTPGGGAAAAPARATPRRHASQPEGSASPFLPESGDPPEFDAPRRDRATVEERSTAGSTTTYRASDPPADSRAAVRPSSEPAGSSGPAPVDRAPTPSSSQFSQEFTP